MKDQPVRLDKGGVGIGTGKRAFHRYDRRCLNAVDRLPSVRIHMTPVYDIENVNPGAGTEDSPLRWIYRLEPVVASFALAILSPVAFTIGAVIAILSGRSPLIRHTRVGQRGLPLPMLKFRTMWGDGPPNNESMFVEDVSDSVPESKKEGDPRVVSRFAALCRRYSLDEIPQLYHVARGQMSFVGPRPITRAELDKYYGPHSAEVLQLRPGLTGLWQVLGRSRLSYSRRRKLDIILVRRASPNLYFWILWRTVPAVLRGYDAC
jgi:exopolysaccharide production protein ExoY